MISILKKELNSFFSSPIAYLVIGIFLVLNGLFLFVFNDDFNMLNAGYADLNSFFFLAPWVFLFLIPAVTMKSFSEEFQTGTIELLQTKPITNWQLVLGKFWGAFLLVFIAILPTLTYVVTVYSLGNPIGNIDFGSTLGAYIGLLFLAASYTAVGLFTSSLTKNQIVAFILGVVIMFFIFYGFEAIATAMESLSFLQFMGINEHFKSISRGVIDTKDICYFISCIGFFLLLTKLRLDHE